MERENGGGLRIGDALDKIDKGSSGNSMDLVVFETVIVIESEERASISGKNEDMAAKVDQLNSSKVLGEAYERVMVQETSDPGGIGEASSQVDERESGSLSNSVGGFLFGTVIVIDSDDAGCIIRENGDSQAKDNELKTGDQQGMHKALGQVDQGTSEGTENSANGVVLETLMNLEENAHVSGENGGSEVKGNELGSSKVQVKESKTKVPKGEKHSYVLDVNCGGGGGCYENWDGESVCRICHLSSEQSSETSTTTLDLIQLGCGCKDELGIAHSHCAETWFKLKGNRMCEICGETAKNITGVGDNRFMEEWSERRITGNSSHSSNRGAACWRGQPFCNFLMACLVIAFVLPWFFRVNMF